MNTLKAKFAMAVSGGGIATLITSIVTGLGVAHAQAYDYIVSATDTVPIFEQTAQVAKSNGLAVLGVGLPYFVGFMIALVILALVLLPIRKIWGAMHF